MEGGSFLCGDSTATRNTIELKGNDDSWDGLNLEECTQVRIYGTIIENVRNSQTQDSSLYSVRFINSTDVIIKNSSISSEGIGAISSIADTVSSENPVNYFSGNVFELEEFSGNTVRFVESGYITVPVRIEYCTFNSGTNYKGKIAIFLSGVLAGSIKYNQIEDYNTGINLLNTSVDLNSNSISSTVSGSILVNVLSGSNAILGYFDSEVLGGYKDFYHFNRQII